VTRRVGRPEPANTLNAAETTTTPDSRSRRGRFVLVGDTGIEPATSSVSGIITVLSNSALSTKTVPRRPLVSPHTRGRCHAISQSPRHPNTSGQTVPLSSWRHRFSLPQFRGRFRRADHRRLRRFASDRSAHREPSACLRSSRDDYGVLKSGTEIEPSSARGNPGLCATSQAWPSGSIKIAA